MRCGAARQLANAEYFSLRYDKVGHGGSKPKKAWTGSYHDEAEVSAAAIKFARGRKDVGPVVAAGESAGAYVCCLAAAEGAHADAYIFLGGHCGPGEAIYEYNFKRLAELAAGDAAWREWAEKNCGSSWRWGDTIRKCSPRPRPVRRTSS